VLLQCGHGQGLHTRARETIDQAHIYEIGNLNEIGGGVRIEVHKLYEAVFLKRENTVSGFVTVNGKREKKNFRSAP
jgi:hypothetical protein